MATKDISSKETNYQLSSSLDINEFRAWFYDLRFNPDGSFPRVVKLCCGPSEITLPINHDIFNALDDAFAEVEGLTFEAEGN